MKRERKKEGAGWFPLFVFGTGYPASLEAGFPTFEVFDIPVSCFSNLLFFSNPHGLTSTRSKSLEARKRALTQRNRKLIAVNGQLVFLYRTPNAERRMQKLFKSTTDFLISAIGLLPRKHHPQSGWRPPRVRVIAFISLTCRIYS